ncbi:MAG TPA: FAD-binding oxidoreductase [Pseudolabrys sp.]|nr:FAD-binding oxidoreductase [Pseudolabrys sp.]
MTQGNSDDPSWYALAGPVEAPPRPALNFDLDVDVCVIGAGLAGLTAAREIARRGWSVAVLEADRIGSAASGRNTGFVLPGFGEDIERIVERIGLDHAKQLWSLSEAGADYVRRSIAETQMPGVDPVDGWLHVSKTDSRNEVFSLVERLRWIGAGVEAWSTERVRDVLSSRHYFQAVHYPQAFHINPLNYTLGLARAAEKAGARIFEGSPAVEIDPAGVRKRISTPQARLRAPHVVLAGNLQIGSLVPRLGATLLPVSIYAIVTEPLGDKLREVIRYRGAVSDTDHVDNHYRVVDGDRLMWTGRATTWESDPRWWVGGLIGDIRRVFPALGDVKIAHRWRGTLGLPIHRMPQIGELNRGLWVASGFGAHGLNTTAMAGELVARGIVEGDQTWRAFGPYELVWAGGAIGRAAVQGLYWGRMPLRKAAQGFSRYRERARERTAAKRAAAAAATTAKAAPTAPPGCAAEAPLERAGEPSALP